MTDETAYEGDPRDHPDRFETKNLPGGYGPAKTPATTNLGYGTPGEQTRDYAVEPSVSTASQESATSSTGSPGLDDGKTNVEQAAEAGVEQPATPEVAEREQAAETGQLHTPDTEHDQQNAPA